MCFSLFSQNFCFRLFENCFQLFWSYLRYLYKWILAKNCCSRMNLSYHRENMSLRPSDHDHWVSRKLASEHLKLLSIKFTYSWLEQVAGELVQRSLSSFWCLLKVMLNQINFVFLPLFSLIFFLSCQIKFLERLSKNEILGKLSTSHRDSNG